ncbi:hypothetical protein AURDEDRAFT_173360 [Auricularia subglabra TFB-10046 SS5]|nr:hypothetical protein AURDEDRAFT_173360 [Auricularia subglabra TFB-10046 SS5]
MGSGSDDRRQTLLSSLAFGMMGATHGITNLLVAHGDLVRRNVLWPANNYASGNTFDITGPIRYPVLIDFDGAFPLVGGGKFVMLQTGLRTLGDLLRDAENRPLGFDEKTCAAWLDAKMREFVELQNMYDEDESIVQFYFSNMRGEVPPEE